MAPPIYNAYILLSHDDATNSSTTGKTQESVKQILNAIHNKYLAGNIERVLFNDFMVKKKLL